MACTHSNLVRGGVGPHPLTSISLTKQTRSARGAKGLISVSSNRIFHFLGTGDFVPPRQSPRAFTIRNAFDRLLRCGTLSRSVEQTWCDGRISRNKIARNDPRLRYQSQNLFWPA